MHTMVFVIGDVAKQMDALQAGGWRDGWAPGGRYTGALRLKDAMQGKASRDAMRDVAEWMCQQAVAIPRRIDHTVYGGVDQAMVGDVDFVALRAARSYATVRWNSTTSTTFGPCHALS